MRVEEGVALVCTICKQRVRWGATTPAGTWDSNLLTCACGTAKASIASRIGEYEDDAWLIPSMEPIFEYEVPDTLSTDLSLVQHLPLPPGPAEETGPRQTEFPELRNHSVELAFHCCMECQFCGGHGGLEYICVDGEELELREFLRRFPSTQLPRIYDDNAALPEPFMVAYHCDSGCW